MTPSNRTLRRLSVAAGVLALAASATSPVLGGARPDSPFRVEFFTVNGDLASLSILNPTAMVQTGHLIFRSSHDRETTVQVVPVTLSGGQRATLQLSSSSTLDGVTEVGVILDDGSPF